MKTVCCEHLLAASENSGLKGYTLPDEESEDDEFFDRENQLAKPDNNLWDDWEEMPKEDWKSKVD